MAGKPFNQRKKVREWMRAKTGKMEVLLERANSDNRGGYASARQGCTSPEGNSSRTSALALGTASGYSGGGSSQECIETVSPFCDQLQLFLEEEALATVSHTVVTSSFSNRVVLLCEAALEEVMENAAVQ